MSPPPPGGTPIVKLQRRQPAWLVSFADLMTLLFAFFVLLLSFSEVNSDSFKKNAGPIAEAFQAKRSKTTDPITENAPAKTESPLIIDMVRPTPKLDRPIDPDEDNTVEDMTEHLRFVMAAEIKDDMVEIIVKGNLVTIRFKDRAAFTAGDRELKPAILPALSSIAHVLGKTPGRIRVEGHTDPIPISTSLYRSNWDLSAARAASVVHHLLSYGEIEPSRISAQGFADSRPLVPNDTPDGRAVNRRVEILIDLRPVEPEPR